MSNGPSTRFPRGWGLELFGLFLYHTAFNEEAAVLKKHRLVHSLTRTVFRNFALALATSLVVLAVPPVEAFTQAYKPYSSQGAAEAEQAQRSQVIALSELPVQARDVHRRIHEGGPFRYSKDGSVFGNRERLLPRRPRGFYREYTVPTPGERDRGARRIVCGGKEVRQPETCFYTRDHYASFQQIDPRR